MHKMSDMFFFNDTATTEIYTLSLHDALPISLVLTQDEGVLVELVHLEGRVGVGGAVGGAVNPSNVERACHDESPPATPDRKSTRLNSSHANISYAVFCLKKKTLSTSTNHYCH